MYEYIIVIIIVVITVIKTADGINSIASHYTITKTNSTNNNWIFDGKAVRFKRALSDDGGNTLVTSRAIKKGERLITIPFTMCLLCHRSGIVRGLGGQSNKVLDICGDLRNSLSDDDIIKGRTWDIQLALALLDASCGEGLAGEIELADEDSQVSVPLFWDSYSLDLPKPEDITVPFCMNLQVLNEIQDSDIKLGATLQQKRLTSLFPSLEEPKSWHRVTAMSLNKIHSSIANPLRWAFSQVRSRCFMVLEDLDWFGVVPIIDMCNHKINPNAQIIVHRNSDNLTNDTVMNIKDYAVCLYALDDIPSDYEITISYGNYDNDRLFVQYGFSIEGNIYDRIKWTAQYNNTNYDTNNDTLKQMKIEITMKAIDSIIDNINTNNNDISKYRHIAVRESLREGLLLAHHRNVTLIEGLQYLHDDLNKIERQYPTTLEEDRLIYDEINSNISNINRSIQLLTCLKFRLERKVILNIAKNIIVDAIKMLKGY